MDAGSSVTATAAHPSDRQRERGAHGERAAGIPRPRCPIHPNRLGAFDAGDVNTAQANSARIEDYLLGGKDNYRVDRDAAEEIRALPGDAVATVQANRAYLAEAVRAAAAHGVRQVLDIGAGLNPATADAAVQAAAQAGRTARVVLVERDPVTLVHLQAQWERDDELVHAAALYGDLLWPEETFLRDLRLFHVLNPGEPTIVVLGAMLHHITDVERPQHAVARLMRAMPAGSRLVITHATADPVPDEAEAWAACYRAADIPLVLRTGGQVTGFFGGLALAEAGMIPLGDGEQAQPSWMLGAAGCTR